MKKVTRLILLILILINIIAATTCYFVTKDMHNALWHLGLAILLTIIDTRNELLK